MIMLLLALINSGCGPSSPSDGPKTEDQVRDEKKIQELAKKGYNFKEIGSIMKGEEPPPRAKTKGRTGKRE